MEHPGGDVSACELINKLELVSQTFVYTCVPGISSIIPHRNAYRLRRGSSWISDTIAKHDTLLDNGKFIGKSSYLMEIWFGTHSQLMKSAKVDVFERISVIE